MTELAKLKLNTRLFTNSEAGAIINNYLTKKKEKSIKTYRSYKSSFNEFFITTIGKDINALTWTDLINLTYNDCLLYQEYLKNKGNANQSINSKITPLHKLFQDLKRHNDNINPDILNLEKLDVNPHDIKTIGTLSEQEVNSLLKFSNTKDYRPDMQRIFFRTSFITMLRSDCVLNLTLDQLSQITDQKTGKLIYVLKTSQKRKHDITAIPDDLAQELLALTQKYPNDNNRFFNMDDRTLSATLKQFCEKHSIPSERNISLHSLKKAGTDYVYYNSGKDIAATAKSAHHSSIDTTYRHYVLKNNNLTEQLNYSLHQDKVDISMLKDLNKTELLKLIKKGGDALIRQLIQLRENQ